jgi:hypothetical protein
VSTGNRSQSFARADLDPSLSSSGADVYKRVQGATTDTLTLTRPSASTSGRLNYQYVGGGVWQRTTEGTTISGSVDSFAYGVRTPDAQVPRAGSARFGVDLLGITAFPDAVGALSGSGAVTVDFATGTLTGLGDATQTVVAGSPGGAGAGDWQLTATLGTGNGLSGTFRLFASSPYRIEGPINGRFFGPQANEIGAAFALTGANASGQGSVSGLLLGRRQTDGETGLNTSLTDLRFDELFELASSGYRFRIDQATGALGSRSDTQIADAVQLQYRVADNSYEVLSNGVSFARFDATKIVASESNDRVTVYRSGSGNETDRLLLFKPGPGNSELVLTYTSFGSIDHMRPADFEPGKNLLQRSWFAYGIATPASAVPTSGQGSYTANLHGEAFASEGLATQYALEGSASFKFFFDTLVVNGSLQPVAVASDGTRTDLGQIDLAVSPGTVSPSGRFFTTFGVDGSVNGRFFGPHAEEIGGSFRGSFAAPGSNSLSGYMTGAFVGTRCAATC